MSPDQNPTPTPAQPTATPATPPTAPTATPTPPAPAPATPAPQAATPPASATPATPANNTTTPPAPTPDISQADSCKCPVVSAAEWDKKKTKINKTFFKAYSPRLFYYPFSFVIDLLRARNGATAKGYKVVENGMIMDDGAMFLGNVYVEVTGANTNDPNVLTLEGKEVYTRVSKNDYKNIKSDIAEVTKELGKPPAQLFVWWTSCPKCMANKEVKAVLVALP